MINSLGGKMDIVWRLISQYLAGKITAKEFANSFYQEFRKCLKIHRAISHYFNGVYDESRFQVDLMEISEGLESPKSSVSVQAFQLIDGQIVDCLVRDLSA